MNADDDTPRDMHLTPHLAACDKALAAGQTPPEAALPPELRPELERGLACIQLLRRVLPQRGAAATPARPPEPLPRHLGRFEIRRELGRGAFGVVFQAYDPHLGRDVALKVPRPEALISGELRERFLREARAAAGLDHPNLVPVFEAGEVGSIAYIASAYCPGVTLASWLKERTEPIPAPEAARLTATLAEAVEHAHRRGVVHRDLKPGNILLQELATDEHRLTQIKDKKGPIRVHLCSSVADFLPKITDFGLAKLTTATSAGPTNEGEAQTQSGAVLGTPHYMAPEQATGRNKDTGPAADVYALGVILYELLTGSPPFRGETALETLEQVRALEPVPPRRLRPRLPRDLETICLKCLQKEPGQRYACAADLAGDLYRFLSGEAIRARPVSPLGRMWRWGRRKPAVASLVAILALVLAAGSAGVVSQWRRAEEHRRRDEESARQARAAVNRFYTLISTETLLHEPGLQPLRKKLLEEALDYYSDFIRQRGDEPGLEDELATIYQNVAYIRAEVGDTAAALQAALQGHELRLRLAQADPDNAESQRKLGSSWACLGSCQWFADQADAALDSSGEALRIRSRLVQTYADDPELVLDESCTHLFIGMLAARAGRREEALQAYQRARTLQEQLVQNFPDRPKYQHELAQTLMNIGTVRQQAGDLDAALCCYEQARDRLATLAAAHPNVWEYVSLLGGSWHDISYVQGYRQQPAAALEAADKARALFAQAVQANPAVTRYRHELTMCLNQLGNLQQDADPKAALESYKEALRQVEHLARTNPADVFIHRAQADIWLNMGTVYAQHGEPAKAVAHIQQARDFWKKLSAAQPSEWGYRQRLGVSQHNLGEAHEAQGRWDAAAQAYQQCLDVRKQLVRELPAYRELHDELANAYLSLASLRTKTGQQAAAADLCAQAMATLEPLVRDHPDYAAARATLVQAQFGRAHALALLGDHEQAVASAQISADQAELTEGDLYNWACVYALCVDAVGHDGRLPALEKMRRTELYAVRALGLLKKAQAKGYFKAQGMVEQTEKDSDLKSLRSRADFQKLLPKIQGSRGK